MTNQDVETMRQAAYVMAQTAAAYARIEGMKAANAEREQRGHALAYSEDAFNEVANEFGLYHNAVVVRLSGGG